MDYFWYGIILMLIQLGIFAWVLDLYFDRKPTLVEDHGSDHHDSHH
ncbi:MAG: hypothetical protein SCK28_13005 [Bacillota bacterium]|nr:hypothetical protein [Bacillota bacterium]